MNHPETHTAANARKRASVLASGSQYRCVGQIDLRGKARATWLCRLCAPSTGRSEKPCPRQCHCQILPVCSLQYPANFYRLPSCRTPQENRWGKASAAPHCGIPAVHRQSPPKAGRPRLKEVHLTARIQTHNYGIMIRAFGGSGTWALQVCTLKRSRTDRARHHGSLDLSAHNQAPAELVLLPRFQAETGVALRSHAQRVKSNRQRTNYN